PYSDSHLAIITIWIAGVKFGNGASTVLALTTDRMKMLCDEGDKLSRPEICGLTGREALDQVVGCLYDDEVGLEDAVFYEDIYRRHVLSPGLNEAFDGDRIIIVECSAKIRVIFQRYGELECQEQSFPRSEFFQVINKFLELNEEQP